MLESKRNLMEEMELIPVAELLARHERALQRKDVNEMVAAQKVMAKRGYYEEIFIDIHECLLERLRLYDLNLKDGFISSLALSLTEMRKGSRVLGRIGYFLNSELLLYARRQRNEFLEVDDLTRDLAGYFQFPHDDQGEGLCEREKAVKIAKWEDEVRTEQFVCLLDMAMRVLSMPLIEYAAFILMYRGYYEEMFVLLQEYAGSEITFSFLERAPAWRNREDIKRAGAMILILVGREHECGLCMKKELEKAIKINRQLSELAGKDPRREPGGDL